MENDIYIIEIPSAISGNCIIGEGETEEAAWQDAYGPRPWDSFTRRYAKEAWCRHVSREERDEIWAAHYQR